MALNPLTVKKLRRFRSIRRGYVSFLVLTGLIVQRLIEVWSNIPFLYMVIIIFSVIPST